jgi:hypothetical protein
MSYSYASNLNLRGAQRGAALTTATSSFVGVVRVDNTTLLVDANGTISVDSTALNNLSSFAVTNIAAVSSFAVTNIASVSSTLYSLIFAPKTLITKQTLVGSTTSIGVKLSSAIEGISVSSVASTGTINVDLTTQSTIFNTTNATGNFTINFRGNASNSLDSVLAVGESITAAFLTNNGATAYYNTSVTVDSATPTVRWQNGVTPTAGNTNSTDIYSYIILKTAAATFTVFATLTKFA